MTPTTRFRRAIRHLTLDSALLIGVSALSAQTVQPPVILFTDLVSGPATGNSDSSQPGQVASQDGAIVTVWGRNLGTIPGTITVGSIAARIYSWGNATGPADLYTYHKMQMVAFQIPHGVSNGATTIQATVGGVASNTLPFTVQPGNIYFVSANGNDSAAGSWSAPWAKVSTSLTKMSPGDTIYLENGVQQVSSASPVHSSTSMALEYNLSASQRATQSLPKAVVAYPGATANIGSATVDGWDIYAGGNDNSLYWTFSKLMLTGNAAAATYYTGFRLIGNHVSCPNGDGETGCIQGISSDHLYILGNEITSAGYAGTSKLYHPMYVQSVELSNGYSVSAAAATPSGGNTYVTLTLNQDVGYEGFAVGGTVRTYNFSPSAYNGAWTITSWDGAGTMTFTVPGNPGAIGTRGVLRAPDELYREISWNYLHDNYAYDGINIYRENTYSAFMLQTRVHDNVILNQSGRGLMYSAYLVGPDNYVYNNLIIHAGKGPDTKYTSDPVFNFQCMYIGPGWPAYPGTTTVHIYNNTAYDCGFNTTTQGADEGVFEYDNTYPSTLDIHNNIFYATNWPYVGNYSAIPPNGSGTNNLWYGQGNGPSWSNNNVNANPLVVRTSAPDMHLQSGSPAIGAGSTIAPSVAVDFDNLTRPSPPSIGAFEFSSATAPPPDLTAPSVPSGLSANAVSPSQINLSWTPSTDPDNSASQIAYAVYRNGTQIAKTAPGNTSYSDTGLPAATSYAYTVAAFDPAGNTSEQSSQVFVTTSSNPVPVISSFTANPSSITSGGSSTLSWSVTSATSLSISGVGIVTGSSISVSPAQTTTYTLTATNSAGSVTAQTTLTVTVVPVVSITISPTTIALGQGQQQPFTATVTGSTNTAVTWSFTPTVGTLSSAALYTAPSTVSATQSITIKATSVADSTKSATATITLQPPASPPPPSTVSISVTPPSVILGPSQQQPFAAIVSGSTNTAVTWSFLPAIGLLSSTGIYTAPAMIPSALVITVKATSVADPSKSASATLTLQPSSNGVSVNVSPNLVDLRAGRRRQFRAIVTGATTSAVTWSLSPTIGQISTTGVYTAPAALNSDQTVTIKATSKADATKSATAIVTLITPGDVQISNFGVSQVTANSACLSWDTNIATSGQVQYGATTAYTQTVPFPIEQWSHTLTLTGLTPGTVYHYRIRAWTDLANGVSSSTDLTFTTLEQ
jgi:hypothetical protein